MLSLVTFLYAANSSHEGCIFFTKTPYAWPGDNIVFGIAMLILACAVKIEQDMSIQKQEITFIL
jgi:hypothetical protein